jgi:hypothetical protein
MPEKCNHTGMYELLEAIEAVVESAEASKRAELKRTINDYMEDFPDEYFWAIGPQSPALLHHIMYAIEPASTGVAPTAADTINLLPSVYETRGLVEVV